VKSIKIEKSNGLLLAAQASLNPYPKIVMYRATEKIKAQVRAKVEHPFLAIKRRFGYHKVRYKGLAKNHDRLCLLAGFYNLIRMDQLAH
jgi:IS5 family transposase